MRTWVIYSCLVAWLSGLDAHARPSRVHGLPSEALILAKKKANKPKRNKLPPAGADKAGVTEATPASPAPTLGEPRALPTKYKAVVLLPLIGIDIEASDLREFESSLMDEIDETPGMRSISPSDATSDLVAVGLNASDCDGALACLARAGRYAGGHFAIETRVAALGGTFSISMRLIDTQKQTEVSRVAEPVSENVQERAGDLHRLAVQLLTPEQFVGTLVIKCSQDGADVFLDDKVIGTTPLKKPLTGLAAGPHILRITKAGFADLYQFVDVLYKRSSTIDVDLATTTIAGVLVESENSGGTGTLRISSTLAGIEIRIDGEPVGTTPLAGALEKIPAGKHRLSARADGKETLVQEFEIPTGQRVELRIDDNGKTLSATVTQMVADGLPTVVVDSSAPPKKHSWRWLAGLGTAGAGGVALVVGGYYGAKVRSTKSDLDALVGDLKTASGTYVCNDRSPAACRSLRKTVESLNNNGTRYETIQWASLATGVVLVGVGAGLVAWELLGADGGATLPDASPTGESAVTLLPWLSPSSAGLQLSLQLAGP